MCVLDILATSALSSNTAVQFCHSVFDSKKPSETLSDLQTQEQNLATVAAKCEITAHARQDADVKKYIEETDNVLANITRNLEQVLQLVSEQERRSLLDWISNVQYGRHHDEIEEKRRSGTGDWLIQHEKFCEWIDSPESGVLWLQGSRKSGKSFIYRKTICSLTSLTSRHW